MPWKDARVEVQDRTDYAVRMALDAADTVPGAGGLTTYEPLYCHWVGSRKQIEAPPG